MKHSSCWPLASACTAAVVAMLGLFGCAAPASIKVLGPQPEVVHSYLTGAQLAQRVLRNVAIVDAGGQRGVAFLVGTSQDTALLLTAAHVVTAKDEVAQSPLAAAPSSAGATVTFCADGAAGKPVAAIVAELDSAADIAMLRVPRAQAPEVERRVLADPSMIRVSDEAWVVGREGSCKVGGTTGEGPTGERKIVIDALAPVDKEVSSYMPGVLPSTSGAPIITGRGIVGMVRAFRVANFATAVDIKTIQSSMALRPAQGAWALELSGNVPPLTKEASQSEITETLDRYLFEARSAQIILSKPTLNEGELQNAIARYNFGITSFFGVMTKHEGSFDRLWAPSLLPSYRKLRYQLLDVHAAFLSLTLDGYIDAMYAAKSGPVPQPVRERMQTVGPKLVELQDAIARFTQSMTGPGGTTS